MILVVVITLPLIFYASYRIENMILEHRYGSDIFDMETWPSEAYAVINIMDKTALVAALIFFVVIVLIYTGVIKRRLLEPLDALEEERRRIMAGISHDLRTPVTVIRGYSGAIADGTAGEEMIEGYINTIKRKADKLSEMIDSLYEFSRLDHPGFEPNLVRGDICECIREYLALKYEELESAGCGLDLDLPEGPLICDFDRVQIERVFDNIINNSIKYNDRGITIHVRAEKTERKLLIHIGDNGRGIPEHIRGNLFEPFVTGSTCRSGEEGSGLGLAIAEMTVKAHGGRIELQKASDAPGANFVVMLPSEGSAKK